MVNFLGKRPRCVSSRGRAKRVGFGLENKIIIFFSFPPNQVTLVNLLHTGFHSEVSEHYYQNLFVLCKQTLKRIKSYLKQFKYVYCYKTVLVHLREEQHIKLGLFEGEE